MALEEEFPDLGDPLTRKLKAQTVETSSNTSRTSKVKATFPRASERQPVPPAAFLLPDSRTFLAVKGRFPLIPYSSYEFMV